MVELENLTYKKKVTCNSQNQSQFSGRIVQL